MKRNRTSLTVIVAASILPSLASCERASSPPRPSAAVSKPTITETLKPQDILSAFKAAKLPIQNEVVYSAETDPNKLLGRPRQYIGKANWGDSRVAGFPDDYLPMTVELFSSPEDLENRRKYVETVTGLIAPMSEYYFIHKNALLRLNHQITPDQATEYEKVLKSL